MTEDICLKTAGRLADALHLNREDHVIFQENIATYLVQLKDAFVQGLQEKGGEELVRSLTHAFAYGETRWGEKLRRDVEKPYSDPEVFRHLDDLQTELGGRLRELIAENHAPFPMKVYISGSPVKGRFGANSDLDVLLDAGNARFCRPREKPGSQVHIQFLPEGAESKRRYLESFGENVSVIPGEILDNPGLLRGLYTRKLEEKGYRVGHTVWKTEKHVIRGKEAQAPNTAGIIWSFADLPV